MDTLHIVTRSRETMLSITQAIQDLITARGWTEGALALFCPHTTAAVTVNEDADPTVTRDILTHLSASIPRAGDYRHAEGNADAHIKTALVGPSVTLLVSEGRLRLGTWQGVFFCEFDGPRERRLWVQWLGREREADKAT